MISILRLRGVDRSRFSLAAATVAVGLACFVAACAGEDGAATDETGEGAGGGGQGGTSAGAAGKASSGAGGAAGLAHAGQAGAGGDESGDGGVGGFGGTEEAGGSDDGGAGGPDDPGGAGGADTGDAGAGGDDTGDAGAGGEDTGAGGTEGMGTAGAPSGGAGKAGAAGTPGTPASEVEMTFTTANIGRDYKAKANVVAVFDKIGDVMDGKSGPRFIGWQEIGEGDPCGGSCEIDALRARFKDAANWDTRIPKGKRPDGGTETVKVPISSKGAEGTAPAVRAVYASAGWAGVSPTRFVTVVYYPERKTSMVNTHFIAGAWSCAGNEAKRRDYWQKAWTVLKAEVAKEHKAGRNVIVTGDLNRARATSKCNPAWTPASLHADAKVIGGTGIDYIFAVPAATHKFVVSKKADGSAKDGEIALGIDSHKAHWVSGKFLPK
jgi:hypothetical protein